jgi:hypothetical protein
MAFENLQRHKSPGVVQINADLIKAWGKKIWFWHPTSF